LTAIARGADQNMASWQWIHVDHPIVRSSPRHDVKRLR
jgi:hypothetical protein